MPDMKHRAAHTTLGDLPTRRHGCGSIVKIAPISSPLACAVAVIRWGRKTSSDRLRRCARYTACGHKGATIQHPGWGGADIGFLPFPAGSVAIP
jgi:hypothetical protein